ncbi:hypothetical protein GpartN1_g7030.t1 [Galdieria partita]|uniref:Probable ATP-dependent transporter ycf16 n=1 Tax=Galdieria partita TaxID=83374 RepID=A0A9C7Q2P0_9RHOD|nr:hypothetical protein GpartN1_g6467.t1 [Galdieria partita]GJQ15239.1 hypothetical protein GpartN1_g7030.t1 [Galdieria partita]
MNAVENSHIPESYTVSIEDPQGDIPVSNTNSESSGALFAWHNVTVKVTVGSSSWKSKLGFSKSPKVIEAGEKLILNSVSGIVEPGQVLFIMGPSGSGKSTLLDSLADRVKLPVYGAVTLDGHPKDAFAFKQDAKYVEQFDHLFSSLTVKETLSYAAQFYCNSEECRASRVEDAMEILGLKNQQNVKVGGVFFRGLSGGQKRRLSVGVELVSAPRLLFLDEPTSGLDSASAFNLIQSLRNIARTRGTTIVCTIHQPSENVFEMCDQLLLLSGGRVAYFGPPKETLDHFGQLGFSIPQHTSVAEWVIDLINADFGDVKTVDQILDAWPTSEKADFLYRRLKQLNITENEEFAVKKQTPLSSIGRKDVQFATSMPWQTSVLVRRGFLNVLRNPAVVWLRFAMYVMLAILIGIVWLRLSQTASNMQNFASALFYVAAFMVFMSISVLPAYLEEKEIFVRERANGTYHVLSYQIAHFLVDVPFVFLLALVSGTICYWLVGMNSSFGRYCFFVWTLFLSLLVAESMMMVIAAIVPYFIVGIAMGAFVFGAFMCVQGFFIPLNNIGWWFRWFRYIALNYYSFANFMKNEFSDLVFAPSPDYIPPYPNPVEGVDYLKQFGFASVNEWGYSGVMIGMAIIYRIIAGFWMWWFHTGKH